MLSESDEINRGQREVQEVPTRKDRIKPEVLSAVELLDVMDRRLASSPVLDAAAILGRQMASYPVLDAAAVLGRQFSKSPILDSFELLGGVMANSPMISAFSVLHDQTVLSKIRKNAELLNRQLASPLVPQIDNMSAVVRALTAASVAPSIVADTTIRPELFTWFTRRPPTDASLGLEHLRAHDVQLVGLAPSPEMERSLGLFDELITDPDLRQVCRRPFADGYYSYSVELAYRCLNNAVKGKSGLTEADGVSLMRNAFSANNPVLRLNGLRTTTEKDEQRGYMELYAGAMAGIRNPRAHELNFVDPPDVALELLVIANHLMRNLRHSTLSKLR